jgi:hypothetical protein
LLSRNQITNDQIDIVMLITPHIVRTHEVTEEDLKPIYIGSQQNLGVGGPPPLIAAPAPVEPVPAPVGPTGTTGPTAGAATPGAPTYTPPGTLPAPGGAQVAVPPGSTPVPGTVLAPPPPQGAPTPNIVVATPPAEPTPAPATTPAPGATPAGATQPPAGPANPPAATAEPAAVPSQSPGIGAAQIILSPPGPTFRVGGGPYTVPISVTDAARLSTLTLTLTFDATKLRVRGVNEGSFMRAGGVDVTFTQQVSGNRVDITLSRATDATGASGTGLIAAVLFDAIAPGSVTLSMSGAATGPGGTAMGLRFNPVTINVQQ